METLAQNKYVLLGGVAVIALIVLASRSSNNTAGNAIGATIASQQSASSANVALAGLTTQQNLAQIQANTSRLADTQAFTIADRQVTATEYATTLGYLAHLDNINGQLALTSENINGSIIQNAQTNDAVLQLEKSIEANRLALAPIQSQTAVSLANVAADQNKTIASIEAANAVTLAQINASTALAIAQTRADAGTNQSLIGNAGGIVGGLGSLAGLAASFFA